MSAPVRNAAWIGAAALFLLCVDLRLRRSTQTPRWDPADATGYFRAESAFQFRYARMAAEGVPIPAVDRDAQWPEGVDTRREVTTLMERLTGAAWRLWPGTRPDLRWFATAWIALVSSLSVLAFFAAALALTRDPPVALAAAAAYGLSWAAQANTAGTYGFEGFALPLMHLGFAAGLAALRRDARDPVPWAFASGAALGLAVASWHFARLYLASLAVALAWTAWARRRDGDALRRLRLLALAAAGGAAAAAIAVPAARPGGGSSLAHAWAMLGAKLSRGLVKPDDPASLSPDARLLWTGPFDSPEPAFLVFCLVPFALVLLPRLLSRREAAPAEGAEAAAALADAMAVLYAGAALMVSRLVPAAAFFAGLAALRFAPRLRKPLLLGCGAIAALEVLILAAPASPLNPVMRLAAPLARTEAGVPAAFRHERALLDWLARRAGPGRPVLAGIGLSGSVVAYSGSPVVLNPKFEAAGIRAKAAEYLGALVADEAALAGFAERHGAAFVVHATADLLDETRNGTRYLAGTRGLRAGMPVFQMHFRPGELRRLTLVYENPDFRVFSVGRSTAAWREPPLAVYREELFGAAAEPDGTVRLDAGRALERMHRSRRQLLLAAMLARRGRLDEALLRYDEAAAQWPAEPALARQFEALRALAAKRSRPL